MKIRSILIYMIVMLVSMLNIGNDFDDYQKLKIENVSSIKREDLPDEFGEGAFKTIDEFIRKTRNLDYEVVVYFDYITGKILKYAKGDSDKVKLIFEEKEFEGCNVAFIHNHPKNSLSPPSGLNFRIFNRSFEDYELVAGFNSFWILKAKGVHENLIYEANFISYEISDGCLESCSLKYSDENIIGRMHDILYGHELLKYINDKNINGIQLTKKEYGTMNTNLKTAEYNCMSRPTHEQIVAARQRALDPTILSGKDKLYALYKIIGMDVDYDSIFAEE